jgi:hypothetical protein
MATYGRSPCLGAVQPSRLMGHTPQMSLPPSASPPDDSTKRPNPKEPAVAKQPEADEGQPAPPMPGNRAPDRLRKGLASVGLLVLGGLIAWATSFLPTKFFEWRADDQSPLAIDVALGHPALAEVNWDDCRGYVIPRDPATVPPPPPLNIDVREARRRWAEALGGCDAGETLITVTVQGRSPRSVVLKELRIHIIERRSPPHGATVSGPCGGPLNVRLVEVDLDHKPPRVVRTLLPDAPEDLKDRTPVEFPYVVSDVDPEQFVIYASTKTCDCIWTAELHWVDRGRSGFTPIDDDGKPFRTIATVNAPAFSSGHGEKIRRVDQP